MCLPELYKSGRNVVLVLVSVVVEVNKPVASPVNDRKDIKSTVWQTRHSITFNTLHWNYSYVLILLSYIFKVSSQRWMWLFLIFNKMDFPSNRGKSYHITVSIQDCYCNQYLWLSCNAGFSCLNKMTWKHNWFPRE